MLTLAKMLTDTPNPIKARARHQCFAKVYAVPRFAKNKPSTTKSGGYIVQDASGKYREFKFRVRCTDGFRKVAIRFYGALNVNTRCWGWCSCPYFKYHCEVSLANKRSSVVVQSNGQRPRFTNPKEDGRVCKHVVLAFAIALRRRTPGDKSFDRLNPPRGKLTGRTKQTLRNVWNGDNLLGTKKRTYE